jgi:hypothetical protein
MSKSYEKHIEGDTVFLCDMTAEERKEYIADEQEKDCQNCPNPIASRFTTNCGAEPRYRMGRQGRYSVDEFGHANNGLIF